MEDQNLDLLAQLIESMDEAVTKLEKDYKKGKRKEVQKTKKEILNFQKRIDELLKK